MSTTRIESFKALQEALVQQKRAYLLLYKSGSEQSECALKNLNETMSMTADLCVFTADVASVRDIHQEYNITSVPALLEFQNGQFKNVFKGCQQAGVIRALFDEAVYYARMEKEGKTPKQVTVYSTPTCSWCTTLKNYLRKNKVRFTDVDISRDQKLSQELVARTGQQGVPQTEVSGQWVVGFDQKKLDELLEIK